jgi:hypothetical protein
MIVRSIFTRAPPNGAFFISARISKRFIVNTIPPPRGGLDRQVLGTQILIHDLPTMTGTTEVPQEERKSEYL